VARPPPPKPPSCAQDVDNDRVVFALDAPGTAADLALNVVYTGIDSAILRSMFGRVLADMYEHNPARALRHASATGCDSAEGTFTVVVDTSVVVDFVPGGCRLRLSPRGRVRA
jgi:hypothetical protein